jgi:AraC-like DNA-binding protein
MPSALAEILLRYTAAQAGDGPHVTAVPGLVVLRADHPRRPSHLIQKPALCVVAQGAKWTHVGGSRMDYREGQALVVSMETPALGSVVEASPEKPYLSAVVEFDLGVMREVLESLEAPIEAGGDLRSGIFVTDFQGPLADGVLRLVRLLETPKAIPVLYPSIMREICYWLLSGPHGGEVARVALGHGHAQRIINAIHHLRERFMEPLRIGELAAMARLSTSAFHRQFKAITAMTPLQYQKQLRLLEARRLMVAGTANAETAAFQVGYESPSQFSREYARMFGAPPRRDIAGLRAATA